MMPAMTTDQALDVIRALADKGEPLAEVDSTERAAYALAAAVIATRTEITDVAAAWGQHRDNPHIPAELRRALDALSARRSGSPD